MQKCQKTFLRGQHHELHCIVSKVHHCIPISIFYLHKSIVLVTKKMERTCFWLNLKYLPTPYVVNYVSHKTTASTCRQHSISDIHISTNVNTPSVLIYNNYLFSMLLGYKGNTEWYHGITLF